MAEELPYRPCVGIMLINRAGLVFVGRRIERAEHVEGAHAWQMPQGGIDPGEDPSPRRCASSTRKPMSTPSRCWRRRRTGSPTTFRAIVGQAGRAATAARPRNGSRCASTATNRDRHREPRRRATSRNSKPGAGSGCDVPDLIVPFKRPVYEQVCANFRHLAREITRTHLVRPRMGRWRPAAGSILLGAVRQRADDCILLARGLEHDAGLPARAGRDRSPAAIARDGSRVRLSTLAQRLRYRPAGRS